MEALASVPGVGERLAECLYADLGISTLEELEAAAPDGRLAEIEGFGEKRITGVSHPHLSKYRVDERYIATFALCRRAAKRGREERVAT